MRRTATAPRTGISILPFSPKPWTRPSKKSSIAGDDGQESRVADLGRYVDERLREIARAGAATNESHLLVLTALVLADEVYDIRDDLQGALHSLQSQTANENNQIVNEEEERQIVQALNHLAPRLDSIAGRIQKA